MMNILTKKEDIPEGAILVSYSQFQTWQRCRTAFDFSYNLGYTRKVKPAGMALGSLLHTGLEAGYNELIKNPNAVPELLNEMTRQALAAEIANPTSYDSVNQVKRAINLLDRYWHDYQPFEDSGYRPVEVEAWRAVKLEYQGIIFYLQVYIDLILEHKDTGHLWIVDHKSMGSARWYSEIECMMDAQLPTYGAVLSYAGMPVFGYMFNMLNTYEYKSKEPPAIEKLFKRSKTYRTEIELSTLIENMGKTVLDITENRDKPYRAMRRDCSYCQYQEPCILNMKGMPIEIAMAAEFKQKEEGQDSGLPETIEIEGFSPLI